MRMVLLAAAMLVLSACASTAMPEKSSADKANAAAQAARPLYRCDNTSEFLLSLADKQATLDGVGQFFAGQMQRTVLERDGNPNTRSYRNPQVSAEFGLGKDGKDAIVRMSSVPLVLRCRQVASTVDPAQTLR
jgi:hypothetical protein